MSQPKDYVSLSAEDLRQAAAGGDLAAMTALGTRMITGQEAQLAPDEGAGLIGTACDRGDADGALMVATPEAMGFGRPQSWARAFDHLCLAAERGSAKARAQLFLLSPDPDLRAGDGAEHSSSSDFWKRLRDSLDPAALTSAPPKRSLSENPRIRVVDNFASPAKCDWMMAIASPRLQPAAVFDPATGGKRPDPARTNKALEFELIDMDIVVQLIRARIGAATNLPVPVFEPPQVMHYSPGEEFRPHHDFLDAGEAGLADQLARLGQRIATFLIYLNDDFEGGGTIFPKIDISHRGRKGDALFFANIDRSGTPDPLTLHAGQPPTRGEKWIFSQWIRDRSPTSPPPR